MAEIVQPVVRSLLGHVRAPDGPVVIQDLDAWTPADPTIFAIDISFSIGDAADPPEVTDAFEALVCSPPWLTGHLPGLQAEDADGRARWYRTGRGLWLMNRWDPDALQRDLAALLADAAGPNWPVVANRLSRHLDWEYDDRLDEAIGASPPDLG